jgi:hypothetical protein
MNNLAKFIIGFTLWNLGVLMYATIVHHAPTSIYWETGYASAFEIAGNMMMFAYFIGMPIITALWMFTKKGAYR